LKSESDRPSVLQEGEIVRRKWTFQDNHNSIRASRVARIKKIKNKKKKEEE